MGSSRKIVDMAWDLYRAGYSLGDATALACNSVASSPAARRLARITLRGMAEQDDKKTEVHHG